MILKNGTLRKKKEQEVASDYLLRIKDWKVKTMVAAYLETRASFIDAYNSANPRTSFPFETLEGICDTLYVLKEDHHTIFKRVVGSENAKKDDLHKFVPSQAEIDFIAIVGQLFHKALVAREMKYLYKHYDVISLSDSRAETELDEQLEEIRELFDEGVPVVVKFITLHASNIVLLTYLFENMHLLRKSTGFRGYRLLRELTGQKKLSAMYLIVGKYYIESGWYNKAEKILRKILKRNPKNREAHEALNEVKKSQALQKNI